MQPHTIVVSLVGVIALLALLYSVAVNRRHVFLIKYYEAVLSHRKEELADKEDEMDSLFVQLLQWREFTREYQKIVSSLLPTINNLDITAIVAALEDRFQHLNQITETDRRKYMAELRTKEGYAAEAQKVMDYLVERFAGMKTGEKAEDSSILNDNRDN
jgi:hypothetical protein